MAGEHKEAQGATPSGSGLSQVEPAIAVSPLRASIPSARPLAEWAEEDGDVLWWRFPIEEPPFFGSPLSLGHTVEVELRRHNREPVMLSEQVGGWPGYHTHWTPIQIPHAPVDEPPQGRDRNGLGGDSPAGAVPEGQAPIPTPTPQTGEGKSSRARASGIPVEVGGGNVG